VEAKTVEQWARPLGPTVKLHGKPRIVRASSGWQKIPAERACIPIFREGYHYLGRIRVSLLSVSANLPAKTQVDAFDRSGKSAPRAHSGQGRRFPPFLDHPAAKERNDNAITE
jgi:hypothetical protein